jgi:hypothetical protein
MNYRLILFLLLLTLSPIAFTQFYNTGQDPASIKWLQIKTKRFTLIYPESYGQEGLKFAKSLDESFSKLTSLYPVKKVRIPVIIHSFTTFSNGYVAWAPKRMEIYPTPEQNTIPLDPMDQLTTHEMTHVLQMVSLNKGFTKAMSVVSGEQFTGAVSVFLPLWFMEGDAVFAESLLSASGRGRTPSFLKQMKAIVLAKPKMYSYDKFLDGSLKNFTPDQYQYGYQMIAWSYAKYGPQLWNKTLDFTAKYPFSMNPVNVSLFENASLSKSKLFSETFDSLRTIWQKEEKRINPADYNALNPSKKKDYVNYLSPVVIGQDSVIAIKTTFSTAPEFVLINPSTKSEKRIHIPGSMYPFFLSGSNGMIAWVEEKPDPRWENRTYSVIKIMDIRTGIVRQLSYASRYMAAAISNDGKFVAAVENTVRNENSLVIKNAGNGNVLEKIPLPGNVYPQRPQWSQTGDEISIISLSGNGEGIMSWSVKNKEWKTLLNPGRDDLQSAFLRNDSLFFVSSSSGTDNIYILSPDKKISKLTNSRFGAYDAMPEAGKVIFSDYTSSGYNISNVNIKDAIGYSENNIKDPSFLINRFDTLKMIVPEQSITSYKPLPYRKPGHLFSIHTWMPFYADIEKIQADPASARPGITIMSQNQLSTVISSIGYEYATDKTNQIHTTVTWKELPPVFESQLDYGSRPIILKPQGGSVADPAPIQPGIRFTNTVSLPLNFSTGRFSQYLRPLISDEYTNNYIYKPSTETYDYGHSLISGGLFFSNYHLSAIRDIYPKWAQFFDLKYTFAPFNKNLYGSITSLKTAFYFPGLLRNHSIRVRYESEIQNPQKLLYYNRVSIPRGYIYENIIPEKINFFSADYAMPLVYPDLNIPGILFIKRVRSSLFYDYAIWADNNYLDTHQFLHENKILSSFGIELMTDYYILRIPFMVSTGVQTSWRAINELPVFELVFNVDIFGMKIGRRRL